MARVYLAGGGIGGAAAAIALQQAGFGVTVAERADELREVGAGLTLWSNAVLVLRRLGVWDRLAPRCAEIRTAEVRSWRGRPLVASDLGRLGDAAGAPTVGVHRADLHAALAAAAGDVIRLGRTVSGFAQDAGGVTVRFADGWNERADVLVGADGLRSAVRAGGEPRYAGYTSWRGVADVASPPGLSFVAVGRGSQVGLVPIGGGRTYWFASANVPMHGIDRPGGAKADLLKRFADWSEPVPGVIAATDDAAIVRTDIFDRPPAAAWGTGRVTLLGDAAHPTTPNLGQGAGMAIEDALVLARCLEASRDDLPAGLRAYEAARMPRTAWVTKQSWRAGKLLAVEGRFACWLRDRLVASTGWLTRRQIAALVAAGPG